MKSYFIFLQPQVSFLSGKEPHAPDCGNSLGNHRGKRRSPDTHAAEENEHRIQQDIAHRPDEHRAHSDLGKALGGDEGIHSQCQLHKDGSQRIDFQIRICVIDGISAGPKGKEHLPTEEKQYCCQHQRYQNLQQKTSAQNPLRRVVISLSHVNGSPRCSAGTNQRRESRHNHNNRKTDSHAGQRQISISRYMSDIDSIHNIVQHVNQLCGNRGNRQLPKKLSHRFRTQKLFILIQSFFLPVKSIQ